MNSYLKDKGLKKRCKLFGTLFMISLLVSCVNMPNDFPKINGSEELVIYVVGEFLRGKYLNEFPQCKSGEAICMDPPPLGLKVRVLESVNGGPLPEIIFVATTDHYGFSSYDFGSGEPFLIELWTDGESNIMPRYERHYVIENQNGGYILPFWTGDRVNMLPCEVLDLKEELNLNDMSVEDGFPEDELEPDDMKNVTKYLIYNERVYSRYGIKIAKLKKIFGNLNNKALRENCLPDQQ